jgi:hypothetical protein
MTYFHDLTIVRRKAFLGLLLLVAPPILCATQSRAELVPFSIDTYTAVTKKSLSNIQGRHCDLVRPGAILDLLGRSKETMLTFEDGLVRGLLEENGNTIFVDVSGVFEYGSRSYVTTEKALRDTLERHFKCDPPL